MNFTRVLPQAALLCCLHLATAVSAPVIDDRGRALELASPAQRVISLAPGATELLFAAGAGGQLVGAVAYSDYPDTARAVPRIGDASRIDMERVLALAPDLAVAWGSGNSPADLDRLDSLGIPVYVIEARNLQRIGTQLRELGELTGHTEAALQAADDYLSSLNTLKESHASRAPLTVFYQISAQPLMTVSRTHLISEVLAVCGGVNVIALDAPPAPAVSREAVLGLNPEVILAGVFPGEDDDPFAAWRRWPQLAAVRAGHLYQIDVDALVRASPRIIGGVRDVCAALDKARRP